MEPVRKWGVRAWFYLIGVVVTMPYGYFGLLENPRTQWSWWLLPVPAALIVMVIVDNRQERKAWPWAGELLFVAAALAVGLVIAIVVSQFLQ